MIQSKKFKEFVAWMPSSDPNQLISEPYDTLSEESARAILLEKPNNILRVTYPKVNLITDKKELEIKACKEISDSLGKAYREFKREIQLGPQVDVNLIRNVLS